ncbi:putative P-loop-containing kinase [Pseudomonas sp. GM84]|uniref:RNase adapter RapZ n=1 Tax=Pseudomonas sp. GM84 TaxID=1144340 RepID=UPI00026F790B|nr:RNase adapter RapZ [Pseudomonas sp. GM84]EJN38882.1 putative P-loop-containing kinase [Pseudomonas sp. GM84]
MRLIIVSGRSGSGKSTALDVLEDNGFYVIDNLPAGLLPQLAENALINTELLQPKVAVSIDARNLPSHLSRFPELLAEARGRHIQCDVLFLDADEETLLKRFSETRRRHPLTNADRSLAEAIRVESELLGPISDLADLKIDTTSLNLYQLRDTIKLRLLNQPEPGTAFLVESFGFKRGMPVDADLVFDVRCLPNPYWKPELREHSGLEQPVIDYLAAQPDVEEMFNDISSYLLKWLPRFAASNRAYVTIAIGCTGGHHRSVYITERLGKLLQQSLKNVQVRHRDL